MSATSVSAAGETGSTAEPRRVGLLRKLLTSRRGAFGTLVIAAIVLVALLAPWLAPYDPTRIDYLAIAKPPSAAHLLGTDEVGRDILSRLIFGARVSVIVNRLGWQAHTVRAALSGLRKQGLEITTSKSSKTGETVYSIVTRKEAKKNEAAS